MNVICGVLEFLNNLKLYHWNTTSYARHKASDDCFNSIQGLLDNFVEVFIGKYGRSKIFKGQPKMTLTIESDKSEIQCIKDLVAMLENLKLDPKYDSDLINIRDEMLSELNKTLYLFTLE